MKKVVFVIFLTSGILGVFVQCCSDILLHWNLKSFEISFVNMDGSPISADSTVVDTLVCNLSLEQVFVAQNHNKLSNTFVNSSYALSCPEPGEEGMQNKVLEINITSNEAFSNFSTGEELRSICSFQGMSYTDFLEKVNGYGIDYNYSISINSKPTQGVQRNFKIRFTLADGQILEKNSQEIVWY